MVFVPDRLALTFAAGRLAMAFVPDRLALTFAAGRLAMVFVPDRLALTFVPGCFFDLFSIYKDTQHRFYQT